MATVNYKKTGFLTTSQYGKLRGLSPSTVLRAVVDGKVKAMQTPGGHWRIPADALYAVAHNPHWNRKVTKAQIAKAKKLLLAMVNKV